MKHEELTDAVICCFYTVYNTLGYGFLEKIYENALFSIDPPLSVFSDLIRVLLRSSKRTNVWIMLK